jgi:acetyl esterase/lipase
MPKLRSTLTILALAALCCGTAAAQTARNVPYGARSAAGPLTLDVYEPASATEGPRPLVIYIHGGGFVQGDKSTGQRQATSLTAAGYVVASIDYRLAPAEPFPAGPMDVLIAVRYFRAHAERWNIDPNRIALFGTSAGGTLALSAGLGSDLRRFANTVWPDVPSRPNAIVSYFGSTPPSAASPTAWADAGDPPVLLVHGEKDATVQVGHSRSMHAALQAAGVPSRFVRVANAGHLFHPTPKSAVVSPSLAEIEALTVAFLDKHLPRTSDTRQRLVGPAGDGAQPSEPERKP